MIGKFGTVITTSTGGGGTYSKVLREYTSSGTWTKPSGLVFIEVLCIGGGGGAASGGASYRILLASELGATESYTIGAGGPGGAAVTADSTGGATGSDGGETKLGTGSGKAHAFGGLGGRPASAATPSPASSGNWFDDFNRYRSAGQQSSSSGGSGSGSTNESTSNANWNSCIGGSSAGGVNTSNVAGLGGGGTTYFKRNGTSSTAASGGGSAGASGGNGTNNATDRVLSKTMVDAGATKSLGSSGGAGAGGVTTAAGSGGNGGLYGGPGSGGGGSRNGFNSGKGGDGADGLIVIVEHIVS